MLYYYCRRRKKKIPYFFVRLTHSSLQSNTHTKQIRSQDGEGYCCIYIYILTILLQQPGCQRPFLSYLSECERKTAFYHIVERESLKGFLLFVTLKEGEGLSALHLLPDEPDDHAVHAFAVGLGKGGDLGLIPFLYPDTYTVAFFLIYIFCSLVSAPLFAYLCLLAILVTRHCLADGAPDKFHNGFPAGGHRMDGYDLFFPFGNAITTVSNFSWYFLTALFFASVDI